MTQLLVHGIKNKPVGQAKPAQKTASVTVTVRDPLVKAYVLQQSAGKCENCAAEAPFLMDDGRPYLEVHHVKHLANGGSDTVENAVALCPNCHRALHYSVNRHVLIEKLYQRIERLVKE